MQIGGVGYEHNSSMHHVTNCVHDHGTMPKKTGGAAALEAASAASVTIRESRFDAGFSLSAWLADPLGNAKKLLGRIWHGSDESGSVSGNRTTAGSEMGDMAAMAMEKEAAEGVVSGNASGGTGGQAGMQSASDHEALHEPRVAAAAAAAKPQDFVRRNPYFSPVEDAGRQSETFWQKAKVKFEAVMGHLTKRFSFSGRNSFRARQEQQKEDLRKKSHYKRDDLEIDCVLTDESYLLDSYNRRGEYRQLSTKK